MSFLDHLEELRWRLMRSAIAVIIFAIVIWIYQGNHGKCFPDHGGPELRNLQTTLRILKRLHRQNSGELSKHDLIGPIFLCFNDEHHGWSGFSLSIYFLSTVVICQTWTKIQGAQNGQRNRLLCEHPFLHRNSLRIFRGCSIERPIFWCVSNHR